MNMFDYHQSCGCVFESTSHRIDETDVKINLCENNIPYNLQSIYMRENLQGIIINKYDISHAKSFFSTTDR